VIRRSAFGLHLGQIRPHRLVFAQAQSNALTPVRCHNNQQVVLHFSSSNAHLYFDYF
jgi:hypothetical protein